MLSIFVIAGCVLICNGPPVNGYTVAALSGGRGQDYSGSYRTTGGFVGMKDSQSDYSENPSSQRYSSISSAGGGGGGGGGGGSGQSSTTGSSYGSDPSGYGDSGRVGGHVSGYGSANTGGNQASSSSYASDLGAQGGGTSELVGASYATGGSSPGGLSGYSSVGSSGSVANQHGASNLPEYAEAPLGGHGSGGFSLGEYSSGGSSRPASSYASYTLGGPKTAAYTSSGPPHGGQGQSQGHGISSYASSPGISFSGGGHRPISSSSSSYPSEIGQHPGISSGPPSYASAQSLKGFLASMHGPNNYIPHGPHRGSPGHHPFAAAASNHLPGYSPRGPSSGYNFPANSPFPRATGGPNGKIIIVKESSGGHHSPPALMYPGEHHSYPGGMFASPNSGYKIRNLAGSATSHGPPSFASPYASSPNNYNSPSTSSSSHSNSLASSLFSFL